MSHSPLFLSLLLLAGCASPPAPSSPSKLRHEADHVEQSGRRAYRDRDWSAAARWFGRAAEIYDVIDDRAATAAALHNRAESLRRSHRVDVARDEYERALNINEELGLLARQAENLAGLAHCYAIDKDLVRAIETLEVALDLAADAGSDRVRAVIQNDLGLMLLERGDPADRERIVALFESALAFNQSHRTTPHIATSHLNLGRARIARGELVAAENHLQIALEKFRAVDDAAGLAHTHEAFGVLYLELDQPGLARTWLQRARAKFAFLHDEAGLRRVDAVMPSP